MGLRDMLTALSVFDLITPLIVVPLGRHRTGPSHQFGVHESCGLSVYEVTNILRERGIPSYGYTLDRQGHWCFHVPLTHAAEASRLLLEAGLPVANPIGEVDTRPWERRETPTPERQAGWRERWGIR